MSMRNFRDEHCPACHVAMNVQMVTISTGRLDVREAPHVEETEGE